MAVVPVAGVWPDQVNGWVGLVADGLAVVVTLTVAALWLGGRNPVVAYALRVSRRRTVGRVFVRAGHGRARIARACRSAVAGTLDGSAFPGVEGELVWLDRTAEALGLRVPVTVHGLGGSAHDDLHLLGTAYREMSRRLESRGLFGGGTAPVIAGAAEVAAATSALLATHATFARNTAVVNRAEDLSVTTAAGTTLGLGFVRAGLTPGAGVDDIAVSHLHERLVVAGSLMEQLCVVDGVRPRPLALSPEDAAALAGKLTGRFFDGALPSLAGACLQRDPSSGWTRLHLVLAEAAYSTVVATHYAGSRGLGRPRAELSAEAAVLTLSCVVVTSDAYLVAVRRSGNVMTDRGRWAPAVNGNLEMRPRFGIVLDRDVAGIPDPRMAIAREAREELGVDLPARDLEVLGMARLDSAEEVGVSVLLTTCLLDMTVEQLVGRTRFADATEGRWESNGEILAVPVPRDDTARDAALAWTLGAADHQPHLTACIVAMCAPYLLHRAGGDVAAVRDHLAGLAPGPEPAGTRHLERDAAP